MGKTARIRPTRLPEKLLRVRQQLGLSQNELIRQLGFSELLIQASISGYESGTREPSLPVLLRYARIAGIYVDVLIDDELNLPEKLPCKTTHPGIKRKVPRHAR